ncbi:hypothetical protein [Senegalia massiliensis]|uniref:Uncharacterized protein n=1 Tax=Senegalia massiliensis TaxID=1720316 RepID=A0A845QUZ6_9CLOT|nr:hypothetical protein [Senegalia massiliensis]NBI05870.1 hypothetical protein [Senegalia massiliensis]
MNTKKYIITLLLLIIFLNGCNLANNNLISKISNENIKAVLFEREGGATTSKSYQISLLKENEELKNHMKGNIFSASNIWNLDIKWQNSNLLIISFSTNGDSDIYQKVEEFKIDNKVIKINYKEKQN